MKYLYAPHRNFEDYANGRVIYATPGQPAFPVRLASEIFQRGLAHWQAASGEGLCRLYDPTCGGGYWLVALAWLHWDRLAAIYASDIQRDAVNLAARNLSLLSISGLDRRIAEIEKMLADYGKVSHAVALESAHKFRAQLGKELESHPISTQVFQVNATDSQALHQKIEGAGIDLIMADIPYGWHSEWAGQPPAPEPPPVHQLLEALSGIIRPTAVVAIAADKRQAIRHPGYRRLERFQIGKRQVVYLQTQKHPL